MPPASDHGAIQPPCPLVPPTSSCGNIGGMSADTTARLNRLLTGHRRMQMAYVVAKLGVPDLLVDGPRSVDDLAAATGVDRRALEKFLRASVADDLLADAGNAGYALGELGALLRSDVPGSRRAFAIDCGEENYRAWAEAATAVRTGRPGFDIAFGRPYDEWMATHPAELDVALAALGSANVDWKPLLSRDWSTATVVVDVGAGEGHFLVALLTAHPHLIGVALELPHMASRIRELLEGARVAERCRVVAGDFVAAVPEAGDVYVLSRVLFRCDDAEAASLLGNVRAAMSRGARVLIYEMVIPEPPQTDRATQIDVNTFITFGGGTRTEAELRTLAGGAELAVVDVDAVGFGRVLTLSA